jgi:hypothetical protein
VIWQDEFDFRVGDFVYHNSNDEWGHIISFSVSSHNPNIPLAVVKVRGSAGTVRWWLVNLRKKSDEAQ